MHRARSHESAHAEHPLPEAKIPQHALIPRNTAELVDTQDGLNALIAELRAAGRFAYDSEFIGELTYRPKLCLIQVSSAQRVSLIDPLAGLVLSVFWELICDPSIEKIVHAGAQDVEPVIRHVNKEPANLFDTQLAAGFAGLSYPIALSRLVQELCGAKLGKGLTFTHWDQRPLSPMQLRYAADDVRYLPAVHDAISQRLTTLNHVEWSREECTAMCDASQYVFNPDMQYLRVRGASSLTAQGLAILRELTIWRNDAAREEDIPPRSLLKDEILVEMARNPIRTSEKFARVRGLPRPIEAAIWPEDHRRDPARVIIAFRSKPRPARTRAHTQRAVPRRIPLGRRPGHLRRAVDRPRTGHQSRRNRRARSSARPERINRRHAPDERVAKNRPRPTVARSSRRQKAV